MLQILGNYWKHQYLGIISDQLIKNPLEWGLHLRILFCAGKFEHHFLQG